MQRSRRLILWSAGLLASAIGTSAVAQFGGRQRNRGDSSRSSRQSDAESRGASSRAISDPVIAIEHELPSLRIDLQLTPDQAPLFDSFERQIRNAADAGRLRARHATAFHADDGSSVTANTVIGTITDDDVARADAMKEARERMKALFTMLTPDQQKQFDRRIIQSLRDPLGSS
jgi:LTXXQ motif family protein